MPYLQPHYYFFYINRTFSFKLPGSFAKLNARWFCGPFLENSTIAAWNHKNSSAKMPKDVEGFCAFCLSTLLIKTGFLK